ncbi:MAG: hypothetical protein LBK13_13860, partial [Spirochaetales bacterium]|nr:hypothetical protein [Spirochaetales bacterium]
LSILRLSPNRFSGTLVFFRRYSALRHNMSNITDAVLTIALKEYSYSEGVKASPHAFANCSSGQP